MPNIAALGGSIWGQTSLPAGRETAGTEESGGSGEIMQGSVGSASPTKELTMSDFYKLLATQLQYQDMNNPMDTAEMMSQMVQTQMAQAVVKMSSAITDLSTVNLISYASSMMGKEITVAEVDDQGNYTGDETKGVVTGVRLGSVPTVTIGGKEYYLAQIMSIGDTVPDSGEEDEQEQTPEV